MAYGLVVNRNFIGFLIIVYIFRPRFIINPYLQYTLMSHLLITVDTLLLNYCFSKPIDVLKHNTTQRGRGGCIEFFLSVVQLVRQSMEFLIATPLKGLNKIL